MKKAFVENKNIRVSALITHEFKKAADEKLKETVYMDLEGLVNEFGQSVLIDGDDLGVDEWIILSLGPREEEALTLVRGLAEELGFEIK